MIEKGNTEIIRIPVEKATRVRNELGEVVPRIDFLVEEIKNPYIVLEVAVGASIEDIKKAFRRLSKQHHPDTKAGTDQPTSRFHEINTAYTLLMDPLTRNTIDHKLGLPQQSKKQSLESFSKQPVPSFKRNHDQVIFDEYYKRIQELSVDYHSKKISLEKYQQSHESIRNLIYTLILTAVSSAHTVEELFSSEELSAFLQNQLISPDHYLTLTLQRLEKQEIVKQKSESSQIRKSDEDSTLQKLAEKFM